jgi:hypothetical protein
MSSSSGSSRPAAGLGGLSRDAEAFSQAALEPIHFAVIGIMIKSGEVNHAVEDQDTHFHGEGARETASVASSGLRRDGDVSDIFRTGSGARAIRGEGKHIRGAMLLPICFIEAGHGCVAD